MKTRVHLIVTLVITLAAGVASTARADGRPCGDHGGGPGMFGGMGDGPGVLLPLILRHADLSPEQDTKVHEIMDTSHAQVHALFEQLHAANDELVKKLVTPGALQAPDLSAQVQQITQLRQQLMQQGLNSVLAIRGLLRPDQLAKVAQAQAQLQSLRTQMHDIMGPR